MKWRDRLPMIFMFTDSVGGVMLILGGLYALGHYISGRILGSTDLHILLILSLLGAGRALYRRR